MCLFLIWPEAGKTSTIEDYICKTLAEDPNHRFRIISEGQDLSKRIVGTCARRFTETNDYPHFQARYGPFYEKGQERQGKPWTTDQITVWKNSGMERDRSLVAQSWSGANYGSRIDTLIIDDVQSQRNYGQSEEIFRRIRGTFFNRGKEMRTLIVGTRIGPDDFYDRMMNAGLITRKGRAPGDEGGRHPVLSRRGQGVGELDGPRRRTVLFRVPGMSERRVSAIPEGVSRTGETPSRRGILVGELHAETHLRPADHLRSTD